MIVMKFGGVDVSTPENIERIIEIVKDARKKEDGVVVVVSAVSGITDKLLEISKRIVNVPSVAVEIEAKKFCDEIFQIHKDLAEKSIKTKKDLKKAMTKITNLLNELRVTLIGIGYLEENNPKFTDHVLSYGEKMSSQIVSSAIQSRGIPSVPLTGSEAGIITDSNFSEARPLSLVKETIPNSLLPLLNQKIVPVVAGFIAADKKGRSTTLGRGGSDYTAALLAKYLNAREVQIYKDVDGIMSADPKIVKNAKLIDKISYVEAMDLATFGAKVIYSRMIEPAMEANIPVRVKSLFHPEREGSVIVKTEEKVKGIVKAVTSVKNVVVINVKGVGMAETHGLAGKIFSSLGNEGINVMAITGSSSSSLSFVVKKEDLEDTVEILNSFIDQSIREIEVIDNVSIVAVIGTGMRGSVGIAAKIFENVAKCNANIILISQGSSEVNISFVVKEEDTEKVVKELHRKFIEEQEVK
ncbi:MAG: aspartate kinase [Candidatus Altarchaeaceae archaeon]